MKNNTRKLLLFLYPKLKERYALPLSSLELICPDLTNSGRLSLVKLLEKRGWVLLLNQPDKQKTISLTSLGRAALEREIPLLLPKNSDELKRWTGVLFCQSSKRDPEFRNLRRLIINNGGLALSRGMYLFAGGLPVKLQNVVSSLYEQQISIFTIDEWIFGKDPALLFDKSGLARIVDLYSSVSKEADELLSISDNNKSLNNKRKKQIESLIQRLYDNSLEDCALVQRFYPDMFPIGVVLEKVQKLLLIINFD